MRTSSVKHNCRTRHDNLNRLLVSIGTEHGIDAYREPKFLPQTIATVNENRKRRNDNRPASEPLEREAADDERPDVKWVGLTGHPLYTDTTFYDAMAATNIKDLTSKRKQRRKEKHAKYDELIATEDPGSVLQVLEFTALGMTDADTRGFIDRIAKHNKPPTREHDTDERTLIASRVATQIAMDNAKILRRALAAARGHRPPATDS